MAAARASGTRSGAPAGAGQALSSSISRALSPTTIRPLARSTSTGTVARRAGSAPARRYSACRLEHPSSGSGNTQRPAAGSGSATTSVMLRSSPRSRQVSQARCAQGQLRPTISRCPPGSAAPAGSGGNWAKGEAGRR